MEMNDTILHEGGHDDISGNAPMIPRKEVIAILNELQLLQTKVLILLSQHSPDHFNETKARQDKVAQPAWASTGSGSPIESHVHTIT